MTLKRQENQDFFNINQNMFSNLSEKKSSNNKKFIKIILTIIAVFFVWFMTYFNSFGNQIITEKSLNIKIEKWDTFYSIPKKLAEKNIHINETLFRLYIKINMPSFPLYAWVFTIPAWANLKDSINAFSNQIKTETNITILEWWNIFDIDERLYNLWLIEKWEFEKLALEPKITLKKDFPFLRRAETLEWFLYPDTYNIDKNNFDAESFAIVMLKNFDKKVYSKIEGYNLNNFMEMMKIASIVEKEEKNPREKPIVAGILYKRYREFWQIWADITACYAHKMTSNDCRLKLSSVILDKNEYNTRQMVWLPKTPISNPNFNTIQATINKENTDYYYYLHDVSTGIIYYSRTLQEHNIKKDIYIR